MHERGQELGQLNLIENREVRGDGGVKKWQESWKNFLVREIDAYAY
jgi:hypothetical protein